MASWTRTREEAIREATHAQYRTTLGLCLGLRGKLSTAIVVIACNRTDPERKLFVVHEFEREEFSADETAEALKVARHLHRPVCAYGYYGGRDDEKIFATLSVRLGMHLAPMPGDSTAPMQLLIDDFRQGRMKVLDDSLVVRDVKQAIWRDGVPDQTGILAALRAAHWGAQQYRQRLKMPPTEGQKVLAAAKDRKRRLESPF